MSKTRHHVRIANEARRDLVEIGQYIALESPTLAVRTLRRLRSAMAELGDRALFYSLVPHHEQSGIRRRVVGTHSLYYRIRGETVEVLHVMHGARDERPLLFPGD